VRADEEVAAQGTELGELTAVNLAPSFGIKIGARLEVVGRTLLAGKLTPNVTTQVLWDVERDCASGAEPELVWWPCTVQALSDGAVDLVLDDGADETLVALHTVRTAVCVCVCVYVRGCIAAPSAGRVSPPHPTHPLSRFCMMPFPSSPSGRRKTS
jgi:hypothetical protein